jgi:hypothetical protein
MLLSMQPKLFYRADRPTMMCSLTAIFTTSASTIGNNLSARSRQTDIAGHVVGLALILNDGTLFTLVEVDRQCLEWS